MSISRRLRVVLALVGVATACLAVLTVPAPAQAAAPLCQAWNCDGKGPVANNCDDTASRIDTAGVAVPAAGGPKGIVQLMYSSGCRSYWARGNSLRTGANPLSADYNVRIIKRNTATNDLVYSHTQTIPDNMDGPLGEYWDWTQMVGPAPGTKLRACALHAGEMACTPWRFAS